MLATACQIRLARYGGLGRAFFLSPLPVTDHGGKRGGPNHNHASLAHSDGNHETLATLGWFNCTSLTVPV
jgi:hypothetical protein